MTIFTPHEQKLLRQLEAHPAVVIEAAARLGSASRPVRGLTTRMRDVLVVIRDHIEAAGVVPSYDEIAVAVGFRSKSNVHRIIKELEARGHVESRPAAARALHIVNPEYAPRGVSA